MDFTTGRRPLGAAADSEVLFFVSDEPFTLCFRQDDGIKKEICSRSEETSPENTGICHTASPGILSPGLYFYGFIHDGVFYPENGEYQLTVFNGEYDAPKGYAGGIIYQIFPDRFNRGGFGYDSSAYPERVIHTNLNDVPEWRPDDKGNILNCDYYCGDLKGIEKKLDHFSALGITAIYLNPIFEAHSNHRYNTADYMRIDPMLGSNDDFVSLCRAAHERKIKVILDGVFNHTGDDSVYFNRVGRYEGPGAYQSLNSPYYGWYSFSSFPDDYSGWWGIKTLPAVNENDPGYRSFICGDGGVIDKWLSLGADGFRLDVADELPDDFIRLIRKAVRKYGDDKILIGEVWENASNKISYGQRRHYLQGDELDSVMNYPFREAVIDFMKDADAVRFTERISSVVEDYPPVMLNNMMNILSTHDTPRLLTELCFDNVRDMSREEQSMLSPDRDTYLRAVELEKLAVVLQYTLPGIPSVYYGDEMGMLGGGDPFCRGFMHWDDYDDNIFGFYKKMGELRHRFPQLSLPDFHPLKTDADHCAAYLRGDLLVAVNRGEEPVKIMGRIVDPWSYVVVET